jgi:hypothetical protein
LPPSIIIFSVEKKRVLQKYFLISLKSLDCQRHEGGREGGLKIKGKKFVGGFYENE